jgi:ubiquinone/menaquinone biosynthesis C-methylase UbiE
MPIGFQQSRRSVDDYFEWRRVRALPAVRQIQDRETLRGKSVLDVGCGYGALASLLFEEGAKVYATEVDERKIAFAKKKLSETSIGFVTVEDETLPFGDEMFDVVMLFDVIEHVVKARKMVEEVLRVAKKRALIYVEFTPFYSVTGHHLYDYTKLPIHLLAERRIKNLIYSRDVASFITQDEYWELYRSLNKLRVSAFQKMMRGTDKIEERFIVKYPDVFSINLRLLNFLGPLKDFFTMSFEGFYQKR